MDWIIVPAENTVIPGFTDWYPPKIAYTNAPWTGLKPSYRTTLQFLHDGQLAPGREYIIWLHFKDERPARFFLAFDLFSAALRHTSRAVLEETFGLKGR